MKSSLPSLFEFHLINSNDNQTQSENIEIDLNTDCELLNPIHHRTTLLLDLLQIGQQNVASINKDLTEVTLQKMECINNQNINIQQKWTLPSPDGYGLSELICSGNEQLPMQLNTPCTTFTQAYHALLTHLNLIQRFWVETGELRAKLPVLSPASSNTGCVVFRLALLSTCELDVTVQVLRPRALPLIHVHGSSEQSSLYLGRFNQQSHLWSDTRSLADNLRIVFRCGTTENDVCFQVAVSDSQMERAQDECFICMQGTERADGACRACRLVFHSECAYKWLIRHKLKKITCGFVLGPCAHCKAQIRVKMPKL